MQNLLTELNNILWSPFLVYLFLGLGLLYTIMTKFVQVVHVKDMIKLTFEKKDNDSKEGVSSFQALSMSLGSRVGTGNIAGVATAIAFGGPGAVFWMWVTAFLNSATSFIEITLTQIYKTKINGELRGGVPYYIEKGLKLKKLAMFSALLTLGVMTLFWPGVQSNTVSLAINNAFHVPTYVTGIVLSALFGAIIIGGVQRISKVAEIIVPFMAIVYLVVCLLIILLNFEIIPSIFSLIISSAFNANATFGGLMGTAIAWGVQRGVYSSGAGVGSETFESGAAEVSHPAKQGLVQAFSVYIDTLLICSATAFMILVTGMYNVKSLNVTNIPNIEPSLYTQYAVESAFPGFGSTFLAISLFFFCFTTLISYYYKAETNLIFLKTKLNINHSWPEWTLKILTICTVFYGSLRSANTAWLLGDIGMGAMAWLNLVVIFALTKTALKVLHDYKDQKKNGMNPVFSPSKLGITNADFWDNTNNSPKKNLRTDRNKELVVGKEFVMDIKK